MSGTPSGRVRAARRPERRAPGSGRGDATGRDQSESAFGAILADLVVRIPGAKAAAFVDGDGETVDYATRGRGYAPFDVKVAAAHMRLVLDDASLPGIARELGPVRRIVVRAARATFVVHALPERYAVVLCMARGAGFRGQLRAVPYSARRLAIEANWEPAEPLKWVPVGVAVDDRGRPTAMGWLIDAQRSLAETTTSPARAAVNGSIGQASTAEIPPNIAPVDVLGRFRTTLPEHERAWRVRTFSGAEFTLVREVGGFWYMDAPDALVPA